MMTPLKKQMYQIPTPKKKDYPGGNIELPDKYPSPFMKLQEVLRKASKGKK